MNESQKLLLKRLFFYALMFVWGFVIGKL